MNVVLRSWTLKDVEFSLKVRNDPKLYKWFRQDEPITIEEQTKFIENDTDVFGEYNGEIVEVDGEPVGLCGIKNTGEFTIAILPEYQHKGISIQVMNQLTNKGFCIWSEVFVGNPALEFFISKCGFKNFLNRLGTSENAAQTKRIIEFRNHYFNKCVTTANT